MLAAYLARAAAAPFVWGRTDCATFLADWYSAATGAADPIQNHRGTYTSEADCITRWGRGYVLRVFVKEIARLGLPRVAGGETAPGDLGIIALRAGEARVICGAIRTARGWVMRGPEGLSSVPYETVTALACWTLA